MLIGTNLYALTSATRTIPGDFVQLPSLLSVTAANDDRMVKNLGGLLAQQILFMGFNFHFGPSFELAPTLPEASGSLLTFGSDPSFAARAGVLFQEAFSEKNLFFVPAGFPGGGANKLGRSAAVLTTPRTMLLESDGLPYRAMIENGVAALHVGNVLVPTLDDENRPASLSKAVISGLLRSELGFQGVVVAGPLNDPMLQGRYDAGDAAVLALQSGADMLYWGNSGLSAVSRAIAKIEAAVVAGALPEEQLLESAKRISELKQKIFRPAKPVTEQQATKQSRQKELYEISTLIERRAITLLKNAGNVLPLINKVSTPTGITGVVGVEELHSLLQKQLKPLAQQRITTAQHIGEIQRFEIERLAKHSSGLRTMICILTDDIRPETQLELVRSLKSGAEKLVVLHLGHPKNINYVSEADAILLAYCDAVNLAQTLQAFSDILMGRAPIILEAMEPIKIKLGESRTFNAYEVVRTPTGRLPITVSERFPVGSAVRYSPEFAIKNVHWEIAGKKTGKESMVYTFDAPGEVQVALTVTDVFNEIQHQTYTFIVE